jgi:hypothetical protein
MTVSLPGDATVFADEMFRLISLQNEQPMQWYCGVLVANPTNNTVASSDD